MQEKKNLTLYKITFLLHVELILGSNQVSCSYKKEATHTSQQEDWLVFFVKCWCRIAKSNLFSENDDHVQCTMYQCQYQTQKASRRYEGVRREYWRRRQDVDGGFLCLGFTSFLYVKLHVIKDVFSVNWYFL